MQILRGRVTDLVFFRLELLSVRVAFTKFTFRLVVIRKVGLCFY